MPKSTVRQDIGPDTVRAAMDLVTFQAPHTEELSERCAWDKLCGPVCRFPRYLRGGKPNGLVATILIELGFGLSVLKELDTEYELGEVLHPGVKIERSRNAAIARIEPSGLALLAFLQENPGGGRTWNEITIDAIRPGWTIKYFDAKRRPWLY